MVRVRHREFENRVPFKPVQQEDFPALVLRTACRNHVFSRLLQFRPETRHPRSAPICGTRLLTLRRIDSGLEDELACSVADPEDREEWGAGVELDIGCSGEAVVVIEWEMREDEAAIGGGGDDAAFVLSFKADGAYSAMCACNP